MRTDIVSLLCIIAQQVLDANCFDFTGQGHRVQEQRRFPCHRAAKLTVMSPTNGVALFKECVMTCEIGAVFDD
jgi:hypothetical protein